MQQDVQFLYLFHRILFKNVQNLLKKFYIEKMVKNQFFKDSWDVTMKLWLKIQNAGHTQ